MQRLPPLLTALRCHVIHRGPGRWLTIIALGWALTTDPEVKAQDGDAGDDALIAAPAAQDELSTQALKRQMDQVEQLGPMLRSYGYWPMPGTDDDDELKDGR
jgi:hypothetical protein